MLVATQQFRNRAAGKIRQARLEAEYHGAPFETFRSYEVGNQNHRLTITKLASGNFLAEYHTGGQSASFIIHQNEIEQNGTND